MVNAASSGGVKGEIPTSPKDGSSFSASTAFIAMRDEKQMVLDNYDHYLKKNQ